MIGQTKLDPEGLNFIENIAHEKLIARDCVQVNARYNVSAYDLHACKNLGMSEDLFSRLRDTIQSDPRSMSKLSEDSGFGRNFVQQMLKDEKDPGAAKMERLLSQFSDEKRIYILTGLHVSLEELEVLKIFSSIPTSARVDAKTVLKRFAEISEP